MIVKGRDQERGLLPMISNPSNSNHLAGEQDLSSHSHNVENLCIHLVFRKRNLLKRKFRIRYEQHSLNSVEEIKKQAEQNTAEKNVRHILMHKTRRCFRSRKHPKH